MSGDGSEGALIRTRGLRVGYSPAAAIAVPDFAVRPGDFLCVTGPNGSGKTTLLKTLAGLLPPLGGEVSKGEGRRVKGEGVRAKDSLDKTNPSPFALRPSLGYLPQQGPTQKDFPASVLEVVRSGCQAARGLRPFYTFAERRRAERILERLGIGDLARRSYRELSGGQRQRVLIARALVLPRRLLLLDEPTAALDAEAAADFRRLLGELNAKGAAVVMVTHEPEAADGSGRVLRLGKEGADA